MINFICFIVVEEKVDVTLELLLVLLIVEPLDKGVLKGLLRSEAETRTELQKVLYHVNGLWRGLRDYDRQRFFLASIEF